MFNDLGLIERSSSGRAQSLSDLQRIYGITEEDVSKALTIDGNIATPVIGESLDPIVQYITLNSANYTPTLRRIRTYKARAHLEQFALTSSLGRSKFGGSAHAEGNLGTADSSVFERVTENQRWFGQVGVVSRTAQRASAAKFGDLKKREAFHRLTKLLLDGEYSIWFGNPDINPYMFRGVFYQMDAIANNQNIVDLVTTGVAGARTTYTGGGILDMDSIRERMQAGLRYGGIHSALYMSANEKIHLANLETSRIRWNVREGSSRVETGITVDQINNPLGPPTDLVWSIFFANGGRIAPQIESDPTNANLFHSDAPLRMAAPTVAAAAGGFLPVNTFYYAVAAINEKAEGPVGIQTTGAATSNTNGIVNVTVTHPADVAKVQSYALYRSTTLPATGDDYANMRFVREVAVAGGAVPGNTQIIADNGAIIPGGRVAALMDESAFSLPELLEPSMRDLADIDNAHRFTIDWEFSPLLHDKALREVYWHNIGGSVED